MLICRIAKLLREDRTESYGSSLKIAGLHKRQFGYYLSTFTYSQILKKQFTVYTLLTHMDCFLITLMYKGKK